MQNCVQATVLSYQFKCINNSCYCHEVLGGQIQMLRHYEAGSAGSTRELSSSPSSFFQISHYLVQYYRFSLISCRVF